MTKYYYEKDVSYERRMFAVKGDGYWIVYPRPMYQHTPHRLQGKEQILEEHYSRVPDMFAILLGVKL